MVTKGKAYAMTLCVLGRNVAEFHYDGSCRIDADVVRELRSDPQTEDCDPQTEDCEMWLGFIVNLCNHLPRLTKEQSAAKAEADYERLFSGQEPVFRLADPS